MTCEAEDGSLDADFSAAVGFLRPPKTISLKAGARVVLLIDTLRCPEGLRASFPRSSTPRGARDPWLS